MVASIPIFCAAVIFLNSAHAFVIKSNVHTTFKPLTARASRRTSNLAMMVTESLISRDRWDFVDDVFLITTTQKENSRLDRTKEQLEKVNLWDRVKVRTFKPDDADRVRGCYTSHIAVLEGRRSFLNILCTGSEASVYTRSLYLSLNSSLKCTNVQQNRFFSQKFRRVSSLKRTTKF
jgi:hypothetical protein